MGCPGAALARQLLLLSLPVLCSAGEAAVGSGTQLWQQHPLQHRPAAGSPARLGEPGPTIDGQALALCTLREGESRSFTCRAPRPAPGAALLWYLNGQRQEANCSATDATSTITLTARRSDRQLSCSLMDVASGEKRDASVLLDVQCKVCGTGQRRGEGAWGSEQDFDPCPSQPEQDGISPVLYSRACRVLLGRQILLLAALPPSLHPSHCPFVAQISRRSCRQMPATRRPRAPGSSCCSSCWCEPTRLPASPGWPQTGK